MNSRLILLLAAGALALTAGPAAAATSLGQVAPGSVPVNGGCTLCADFQIASAPGAAPYAVPPGGGVITSWTFHALSKAGTARLMLFASGPAANQFTLIARTLDRTFALGETSTTMAQIPVSAGTLLGVGVNGPDPLFNSGIEAETYGNFDYTAPLGTSETSLFYTQRRANIAAILEADVDHDGYGDETQDGCPSDPTVQTKCSPPPPASPQPSTPQSSPATTTQAGPLLSLVTPGRESIKSGYVTVSAMSVGKVMVSASGKVGAYKLRSTSRSLEAGSRTTLKLKISKKTLRTIRKRLAHHRKVSAKVTVTAGGNATPVVIRLVR